MINDFIDYLSLSNDINIKDLKKWLKKRKTFAREVHTSLDEKYHLFVNNEDMNSEDEATYSFHDSIICVVSTLISILNQQRYICKV